MAKLIIVANSKARRPAKRWRASSQAVSRPIIAVMGAAAAATSSVVASDGQAEPLKNSPCGACSTWKAVR